MYWPYLRSKENEVLAVRELAPAIAARRLVVPIFNPTTTSNDIKTRLIAIAAGGVRFALVVNPDKGKPIPAVLAVQSLLSAVQAAHSANVFPALEVRSNTTPAELTGFATRYAASRCVIVHRNHTLPGPVVTASLAALGVPPVHVFLDGGTPAALRASVTGGGQVLLRDGFQRCTTNGSYPPQSNFGDLLYTYRTSGVQGFGDFGPLGDIFITGGASPSHVALHLTAPAQGTLICRHFVSTSPTSSHVRTKYLNSVAQLFNHTGSPLAAPFATAGVRDYHGSHQKGRYPGLGLPKRWSLKHHIEMVEAHLATSGATPFV